MHGRYFLRSRNAGIARGIGGVACICRTSTDMAKRRQTSLWFLPQAFRWVLGVRLNFAHISRLILSSLLFRFRNRVPTPAAAVAGLLPYRMLWIPRTRSGCRNEYGLPDQIFFCNPVRWRDIVRRGMPQSISEHM